MRCPKCQFDHPLQTTECLKCGIVFSKYKPPQAETSAAKIPEQMQMFSAGPKPLPFANGAAAQQADAAASAKSPDEKLAAAMVSSFAASLDHALSDEAEKSPAALQKEVAIEFKYRSLALPLTLLVAYWLTGVGGFNMLAGVLAMLVHESGHAVTAWLAGRWAVPTLWFTMTGEHRSWFMVLLVTGAILFGGFQAWRTRRWG